MTSQFDQLQEQFESSGPQMKELYEYVAQTWFRSSVWKPRNICAYKRLVRTNNDCEGYHRRLNSRVGEKPQIYKLIEFLYREAKLVDVTCKILTSKHVNMHWRKKTREAQACLIDLWKQYEEGDIDEKSLLEEAGKLSPF